MNITPTTFSQRKEAFLKTLINNTDKVSKVADNSVLSGIASAIAKTSLLAEKDIAVYMSQLLPDNASGEVLDACAVNFGVSARQTLSSSSVYARLIATPGTVYQKNTHVLKSNSGIQFTLDTDVTIGIEGFSYVKARSVQLGLTCNIDPLTISGFNIAPTGHRAVINETGATGGQNIESDESLRRRIKNISNVFQTGTLAALEQICVRENPNIFKIYYTGLSQIGNIKIQIATENGSDLNELELFNLKKAIRPYLSLSDTNSGIDITNVEYFPIDVSFRIDLDRSVSIDNTRIQIISSMARYLDFRYLDTTKKIEWENLFHIVRSTKGVNYIQDQFFSPRVAIAIPKNKLPRLRGFLMLDLNGKVISDTAGVLSPIFYPNQNDFSFQKIV